MEKQEELEKEVSRLRILNDIYITENEEIKHEYRVLWDQMMAAQHSQVKESIIKRGIRKIKRIIKRIIGRK